MAKRIQVKGKAPRGLSKATRQIDAAQEALDRSGVHMSVRSPKRSDAELAKIAGLGRGITKPSSTRKKLVKEGNPKFIGPRQLKEFDPWEEFEIPEGSWTPRSQHEASRGFKKRDRREDDRRWAEGPMDRLPRSRSWRKPFTEKLSKRDVEELKKEILREAGSKEGRLLYKMLIRNPQLRERWDRRKQDRKNPPPF